MRRQNLLLRCVAAVALGSTCNAAPAQDYPAKPLTFFVPFAAGSATDTLARALAQGVTAETKQNVVIDNRPGASGFIAAQAVAKAAPDGYTVLIATNTTHAANEHLFKKIPYDPVRDFTPVTALARGGQVMVVNPRVPANTVKEFIALAKRQPGKLTFGSGSSSSRVASELFQQMTGIKMVHVPYKSNPMAVTDLVGGHIDMMITDVVTGLPQVQAGKLRALGVSSPRRLPNAPELPTIDEAGVKGYELTFWFAAYLPAKAPAAIVARLRELFVSATKSPSAQSFFKTTGIEPWTTTSAELAQFQSSESAKWARVIKAAGIEPE
ncbi:MAG TPA: tripartite tricarboxylate transporter substrate binding protein [Burkholderiales bacterium]|nr:tripartite tricarboxylate transporter substrate binding protein [Burkholderiales bacterium]